MIWSRRRTLRLGTGSVSSFFIALVRSHDLDCGSIEQSLDVRSLVFLDHLDTRAAGLSDLIDVRTFHQAQADIGVSQTVRRTRLAFAVEAEIFFIEDRLESSRCHFGKIGSVGPGVRHSLASAVSIRGPE
jgi:hypothetical protein